MLNGDYVYTTTAAALNNPVNQREVFSFELVDNDGDTAAGQLNVVLQVGVTPDAFSLNEPFNIGGGAINAVPGWSLNQGTVFASGTNIQFTGDAADPVGGGPGGTSQVLSRTFNLGTSNAQPGELTLVALDIAIAGIGNPDPATLNITYGGVTYATLNTNDGNPTINVSNGATLVDGTYPSISFTLPADAADSGTFELRYTVPSGVAEDFVINDLQVTGPAQSTIITGTTGDDILVGTANSDVIVGGAGNDTLTGGAGADVFKWELGNDGAVGAPAADIITDFSVAEGDVLDLKDLLIGENAGNLTNFLHFEESGANTIVHVNSTGGFAGGFNPAQDTQTITLNNVSLTDLGGANDAAIIQNLLANNQLIVDQ
jgi:Ca2+-binding RTX toxin-like protein